MISLNCTIKYWLWSIRNELRHFMLTEKSIEASLVLVNQIAVIEPSIISDILQAHELLCDFWNSKRVGFLRTKGTVFDLIKPQPNLGPTMSMFGHFYWVLKSEFCFCDKRMRLPSKSLPGFVNTTFSGIYLFIVIFLSGIFSNFRSKVFQNQKSHFKISKYNRRNFLGVFFTIFRKWISEFIFSGFLREISTRTTAGRNS